MYLPDTYRHTTQGNTLWYLLMMPMRLKKIKISWVWSCNRYIESKIKWPIEKFDIHNVITKQSALYQITINTLERIHHSQTIMKSLRLMYFFLKLLVPVASNALQGTWFQWMMAKRSFRRSFLLLGWMYYIDHLWSYLVVAWRICDIPYLITMKKSASFDQAFPSNPQSSCMWITTWASWWFVPVTYLRYEPPTSPTGAPFRDWQPVVPF